MIAPGFIAPSLALHIAVTAVHSRLQGSGDPGTFAGTLLRVVNAPWILGELEKLALRLGVEVRSVVFDRRVIESDGGLCRVGDRHVIVVDARAPVVERIAVLAQSLAFFDLEAIYLPPALRERLRRR